MAQLYKIKTTIENSDLEDLTYAYALIDDNLCDGNSHSWNSYPTVWNIDNIDGALAWIDDKIGSLWRKLPQFRYNYNQGESQIITEYDYPLLLAMKTSAKQLPTVYSSNTTLASSVKFGDVTMSASSNVNIGSNQDVTNIAYNSPITAFISFNKRAANNHGVTFEFQVLASKNIKNNKLHFESGDIDCRINVSLERSGSNYYARIGTNWGYVPQKFITISDLVGASEADDDPYAGDDSQGDDGGSDNWDDESESNPLPPDPSISAVDTGFITLFKPSAQELRNLANYLWSGAFDIATFKKIFADPMDCILGLSIVPAAIPSSSGVVSVGNISTGVSMPKCTTQYVTVDCGTVFLKESRKSYLDYAPYSKLTIFLPYCGMFDLNIDEFQSEEGTYIGVKYKVDILSGGCVAFIFRGDDIVEEHAGQCSMSVPITGHDFTNTIQALCSTVGQVGGLMSAVGGSGNMTPTQVQGHVIQSVANIAGTVAAAKPTIQKSGAIASANGIISMQRPFILLERPKLSAPSYQNAYTGYPSNKTLSVGECSGFTQFQMIHLDGIPMTDEERNELEGMMLGGIIV